MAKLAHAAPTSDSGKVVSSHFPLPGGGHKAIETPPSPPQLLNLFVCSTYGEFDTGSSVLCDINLHFTGSPLSIGCIGAVGGVAGFEPVKCSIVLARPYHYTTGPLPIEILFGSQHSITYSFGML